MTYPPPPPGLELDAVEPRAGRWTLTSTRAAAQFDTTRVALGRAMWQHVERFGAEYAADSPDGTKVVRLEFDRGALVLVSARLRELGARVLAVVTPEEQATGERAVADLRQHLVTGASR